MNSTESCTNRDHVGVNIDTGIESGDYFWLSFVFLALARIWIRMFENGIEFLKTRIRLTYDRVVRIYYPLALLLRVR